LQQMSEYIFWLCTYYLSIQLLVELLRWEWELVLWSDTSDTPSDLFSVYENYAFKT
jgi:hypothetical protein